MFGGVDTSKTAMRLSAVLTGNGAEGILENEFAKRKWTLEKNFCMVLPANEVPTNFWLTGANIVLRIVPPPIKTNHAILPIGVQVVSIPYQYLPPNIHNEYQALHTQWKQKGGKLPDNFTTWDGTQSFK